MSVVTFAAPFSDETLDALRQDATDYAQAFAEQSASARSNIKWYAAGTVGALAAAVLVPPLLTFAIAGTLYGVYGTVQSWRTARRLEQESAAHRAASEFSRPELLAYAREQESTEGLMRRANTIVRTIKQTRLRNAINMAFIGGTIVLDMVAGLGGGAIALADFTGGIGFVASASFGWQAQQSLTTWNTALKTFDVDAVRDLVDQAELQRAGLERVVSVEEDEDADTDDEEFENETAETSEENDIVVTPPPSLPVIPSTTDQKSNRPLGSRLSAALSRLAHPVRPDAEAPPSAAPINLNEARARRAAAEASDLAPQPPSVPGGPGR